ncbi:MAG: hypothetical protein ACTS4Z_01030 [Candidatus Hodgkinia cicadicola]
MIKRKAEGLRVTFRGGGCSFNFATLRGREEKRKLFAGLLTYVLPIGRSIGRKRPMITELANSAREKRWNEVQTGARKRRPNEGSAKRNNRRLFRERKIEITRELASRRLISYRRGWKLGWKNHWLPLRKGTAERSAVPAEVG